MDILILLIICFFIFLYNLYFVGRDDFVIIRKDISIHKIFNTAFLTGILGLFFGRLSFVIFNPRHEFLNILGFIAFPYFPGLSLVGGLIGAIIFLGIYANYRKYPIGKMIDLFALSFLGVLPIGFLLIFIEHLGKTDIIFNLLFLVVFLLSIIFIKIVYKFSEKGEIKDGTFSLMFLSIFAFFYFLIKLFIDIKTFSFFDSENIFLFVVIFASLIILINHEIIDKFLDKK